MNPWSGGRQRKGREPMVDIYPRMICEIQPRHSNLLLKRDGMRLFSGSRIRVGQIERSVSFVAECVSLSPKETTEYAEYTEEDKPIQIHSLFCVFCVFCGLNFIPLLTGTTRYQRIDAQF